MASKTRFHDVSEKDQALHAEIVGILKKLKNRLPRPASKASDSATQVLLAQLFRLIQGQIFRPIASSICRNEFLAEEAVQEALTKAWENIWRIIEEVDNPVTYLKAVVRSSSYDVLRKEVKRQRSLKNSLKGKCQDSPGLTIDSQLTAAYLKLDQVLKSIAFRPGTSVKRAQLHYKRLKIIIGRLYQGCTLEEIAKEVVPKYFRHCCAATVGRYIAEIRTALGRDGRNLI